MSFAKRYLSEATKIIEQLDTEAIEQMAEKVVETRENGGRLFLMGSGGGAGHASHAVCDFRKIAGVEAYSPVDNPSELTARVNDEGWENAYADWLKASRLREEDLLYIFSVGGGDLERNISPNLVKAMQLAQDVGAGIIGVVGRDGGYTAQAADAAVVVPTVNDEHITAHTESFQALVWHLIIMHPSVQTHGMKWESVA